MLIQDTPSAVTVWKNKLKHANLRLSTMLMLGNGNPHGDQMWTPTVHHLHMTPVTSGWGSMVAQIYTVQQRLNYDIR